MTFVFDVIYVLSDLFRQYEMEQHMIKTTGLAGLVARDRSLFPATVSLLLFPCHCFPATVSSSGTHSAFPNTDALYGVLSRVRTALRLKSTSSLYK